MTRLEPGKTRRDRRSFDFVRDFKRRRRARGWVPKTERLRKRRVCSWA